MKVAFTDFTQGIDARFVTSKVPSGSFALIINGRVRDNAVEPILSPLSVARGVPAGKYQRQIVVGKYVTLFVSGQAFIKDFSIDEDYKQVIGFQMNDVVDTIYAVSIPASTMNFKRVSTDGNASSSVNLTSVVGASPRCIVCQDGINNPRLILEDGSTRVAQNYNDWTPEAREYVPRGKQMLFDGGRLYIIDGNKILRSVTGSPLDFMVIIDKDGNKLPEEASGGAAAISHSVSYDDLIAIQTVPASGSFQIFVSTGKGSWFVVPDFNTRWFNEPSFNTQALFETGPASQDAMSDSLSDTIFISPAGPRTFNSVTQTTYGGKNAPFAKRLQRILKGRTQYNAVIGSIDNYKLIAVDTIYGAAVIVWDELSEQFVSIDIYKDIGRIKQFSTYLYGGVYRLLFITEDNQYEFGTGQLYETCKIYVGDIVAGIDKTHSINKIFVVLEDVKISGIVYATQYVDGKITERKSAFVLQESVVDDSYPVTPPFESPSARKLFTVTFNLLDTKLMGTKCGVMLEWAFNAKVAYVQIDTSEQTESVPQNERSNRYKSIANGVPDVTAMSPVSGLQTTIVTLTGTNILLVTSVYINSMICQLVSQSTSELKFIIPVGAISGSVTVNHTYGSVILSPDFIVV